MVASKNGDQCQYSHPRTKGKCLRCGSEAHSLQDCTRPRRQQSSRTNSAKPGSRRDYPKPTGKTAEAQTSKAPTSTDKKKGKGKSKAKDKKYKPSAKSGEVDFDETVQDNPDDQQEPDDGPEDREEEEVYFVDAQTSENEVDSGVMPDWSASECTDYTERACATVACACPTDLARTC